MKGVLGRPGAGLPEKDAVLPNATRLGGIVVDGVSLPLSSIVKE